MARIVSLDHLTVFELTPPELVTVAAQTGFQHVGVRLNPAAPGEHRHPMIGDTPMRRETLRRMGELGVAVFDVGVFRLERTVDVRDFEPVFESAARLGARHALVGVAEPDEQAGADLFASLCELGRGYSLLMNLEFLPWSGVPTLAQAQRIVQLAGQPEGRVLIDAIHLDRVGEGAADVAAASPALLAYAQICDARSPRPVDFETMIYQARQDREFPGDGDLDLPGILMALPPDLPLTLEAPVQPRPGAATALERARRGRATMDALLLSGQGGRVSAG